MASEHPVDLEASPDQQANGIPETLSRMVDCANKLVAMFECMSRSNPVYLPSRYWTNTNVAGLRRLVSAGIEDVKQTLATTYFTWIRGADFHRDFRHLVRRTKLRDWPTVLNGLTWRRVSPRRHLNRHQCLEFALFTRLLWMQVKQYDELGLLERLDEPTEGSPFGVFLGKRLISQDLANSVLEFYSMREQFNPPENEPVRICELGAGYGRDAWIFLNMYPRAKYVVIDIPPALYVSQHYLSTVFPNRPVFQFRCFERFDDVRDEFENADIAFLLPHQAEMLPDQYFDLFINISSLHEMTIQQVRAYFQLIDRITKGHFYFKEWFVGRADMDGAPICADDYPVPDRWRKLYMRPAKIQVDFFEAMYEIP